RVVVDEDHRRGGLANRPAEDLARVDDARGERAFRDLEIAHHAPLPVEHHDVEALLLEPGEAGVEMAVDVLAAADRPPLRQRRAVRSPAERDRRGDRRGAYRSDTGDPGDLARA